MPSFNHTRGDSHLWPCPECIKLMTTTELRRAYNEAVSSYNDRVDRLEEARKENDKLRYFVEELLQNDVTRQREDEIRDFLRN